MRQNEIRVDMVMIPQTHKYSKPIWFVDEVSYDANGNSCANNYGSYDTKAEANKVAVELAEKYNLLFAGFKI